MNCKIELAPHVGQTWYCETHKRLADECMRETIVKIKSFVESDLKDMKYEWFSTENALKSILVVVNQVLEPAPSGHNKG